MVKKVISITGDLYHQKSDGKDYIQHALDLLDELVNYENIPIEKLADAILENPDLIILSIENQVVGQEDSASGWLTPEISKLIIKYVEHGGSWLSLHSGLSNYPQDSDYVKMIKGYFIMHPEQLAVTYQSYIAECPSEFTIIDEHYQIGMIDAYTTIFLRSISNYGESVAGWRHFYGSGKVAGYAPSHNLEGMENETNLAILSTVIGWLLKHQSSVRWKQYLKSQV